MNEGSHQESLKSLIKSAGISRQLVSHCRPVLARWTSAGIQVQCCAFFQVSLLFTNSMTQGWCPSFTGERGRMNFMQISELRDSFKTLLTIGRERLVCQHLPSTSDRISRSTWVDGAGLDTFWSAMCGWHESHHLQRLSFLCGTSFHSSCQSKTKHVKLRCLPWQHVPCREMLYETWWLLLLSAHIYTQSKHERTHIHTQRTNMNTATSLYKWNRPDTYKEGLKKKDCMPWSCLFSYFGLIRPS